jgi:hypothetical protein
MSGDLVASGDGNSARFYIEAERGWILRASYRCTSCMTLVALCEHAAELASGTRLQIATAITGEILLALHPEIPAVRQDRANLAASALLSAILRQPQ